MKGKDFLGSPEGERYRYNSRLHRHLILSVSATLRSKRAMSDAFKDAFQTEVLEQMVRYGRRSFRGRIALELGFSVSGKTPAHPHTLAKSTLDLLGRSRKGRRKSLVFRDDRQIAYLAVDYSFAALKPSLHIHARPFSDFLADIRLAGRIRTKWLHDMDDEDVNHERSWLGDPPKGLGDRAASVWHWMNRHSAQNAFFGQSKLDPTAISLIYRNRGSGRPSDLDDVLAASSEQLAAWVERSPFRMQLPGVPVRSTDRSGFSAGVARAMKTFASNYRGILDPLTMPIGVQVLYRPPRTRHDYWKDLDNLMRELIPVVMETFKPHPQPVTPRALDDSSVGVMLKEQLERIPKTLNPSVLQYKILELPKGAARDGFLSVGLTCLWAESSIWGQTQKIIDKWIDSNDSSL